MGFDPLAVLTERDPVKQAAIVAITERGLALMADHRLDLATYHWNSLQGKAP